MFSQMSFQMFSGDSCVMACRFAEVGDSLAAILGENQVMS